MSDEAQRKFLGKVKKQPSGCWRWTAARDRHGYGRVRHKGDLWYAHRLSFHLWKGPLLPATVVHHLCANKSCVNPDHLQAVTHFENLAEGLSRLELVRRIEKLEAAIRKLGEKP